MDSVYASTMRAPTEFTNQSGCIQSGYVKFPTGTFDTLLASDLSAELKVYLLAIISYGLINFYSGKKLQVQMCGEQWAKRLGCARATAYLQQKALEKEKWLRIVRSKTNNRHDRNILIPSLPHEVFEQLRLQDDYRFDADKRALPRGDAYPLAYLATHKLYFTLPLKLLTDLFSNRNLTANQKLMVIDLIRRGHAQRMGGQKESVFVNTRQLMNRFKVGKSAVSKALKVLSKLEGLVLERCTNLDERKGGRKDKVVYRVVEPQRKAKVIHLSTGAPQSVSEIDHEASETDHEVSKNAQRYIKNIKKNILNKKTAHMEITDQSNDLISASPRVVIDKKDLEKVVKLVQACKQRQEKLSAFGFGAYEIKKQSIRNLSEDEIELLSQAAWGTSDKINQQIARLPKQGRINGVAAVLQQFSSTEKWLHGMLADQLLLPRASAEADNHLTVQAKKLKPNLNAEPAPSYEDMLTAKSLLTNEQYRKVMFWVRQAVKNTDYCLLQTVDEVAYHVKTFAPKTPVKNKFLASLKMATNLIKKGAWITPFNFYKDKEAEYNKKKSIWLQQQRVMG